MDYPKHSKSMKQMTVCSIDYYTPELTAEPEDSLYYFPQHLNQLVQIDNVESTFQLQNHETKPTGNQEKLHITSNQKQRSSLIENRCGLHIG